MSCPDWQALLRHRFEPSEPAPSGWGEARRHLERCSACRRRAYALDPTLVFTASPESELSAAEIDSICRTVAAVRRTQDVEQVTTGSSWLRSLAAAVLLMALGFLAPERAKQETASEEFASSSSGSWIELLPAVESLDRPLARIYQLGQDDLPIVMIVDATLDL